MTKPECGQVGSPVMGIRPSRPEEPTLDPSIKSWIDNVIIPALVDQWEEREAADVAA